MGTNELGAESHRQEVSQLLIVVLTFHVWLMIALDRIVQIVPEVFRKAAADMSMCQMAKLLFLEDVMCVLQDWTLITFNYTLQSPIRVCVLFVGLLVKTKSTKHTQTHPPSS